MGKDGPILRDPSLAAHQPAEASQSPVDALPASPTGHHDAMGAWPAQRAFVAFWAGIPRVTSFWFWGRFPCLVVSRSPSSALVRFLFWGEGSPTKIDDRKKGTLILTSLLEDMVVKHHLFGP